MSKQQSIITENQKIIIFGTIHILIEDFLEGGQFDKKFKESKNQKIVLKKSGIEITIDTTKYGKKNI